MQIEIDIEKLVSRSIIDGILNNPSNLQGEIDNILESDECQNILTEHVKTRLNEILSSEEGKRQIDDSIISEISGSEEIQDEIEKFLESDECQDMLKQRTKVCLHEVTSSEEGKRQMICKIKEYLGNYEIECDDKFRSELSKGVSDILIFMIKDSSKRFKTLQTC